MDLLSIRAYKGGESYVFVSYSHRNREQVLPVVDYMQRQGLRVWFDEGIDPGTEWDENIASHVRKCDFFIAFLSEEYLESDNCKDELNYARDLNKKRLLVYLKNVSLPDGMAMRLNRSQAIHKYLYGDENKFYEKLLAVNSLRQFGPQGGEESDETVSPPFRKKKKPTLLFWVLGVLLIAGAVLFFLLFPFDDSPDGGITDGGEGISTDGVTDSDGQVQPPTMSDNLFDYTFELEGKVYRLPFAYSQLIEDGWALAYVGDNLVEGESYTFASLVREGKQITVELYNNSGNSRPLKECPVGGIVVYRYYGTDIRIANGITQASTAEEIRAALGTAHEVKTEADREGLVYEQTPYEQYAKFVCYTGGEKDYDSYLALRNFAPWEGDETETDPSVPSYLSSYVPPTALGEDLTDSVLSLDGDLYRLPAPLGAFTEKGWKVTAKPDYVVSGGSDWVTVSRNGKTMDLMVINFGILQTLPENCAVISVYVKSAETFPEIRLPAGLGFDSSPTDVEACVTEDFDVSENGETCVYSYSDLDRLFALELTFEGGVLKDLDFRCSFWSGAPLCAE